jgi:hypothetical protein
MNGAVDSAGVVRSDGEVGAGQFTLSGQAAIARELTGQAAIARELTGQAIIDPEPTDPTDPTDQM